MANDDLEVLATLTQLISQMDEAIKTHVRTALVNTHTCLPGIITNCDGNRANVRLALRMVLTNGQELERALIVDAPVMFPQGGGAVLTFPVKAGDECVVFFAERAIDRWQQYGGIQTPEFRLHDMSDGFAFVGVNSNPHAITGVSTSATELRMRDGLTKVAVESGKITLQALTVNIKGNLNVTGVTTNLPVTP